MGTSNWQNIPYCIEVLMKIEPKRVLDVGVGFGRWGIITREFCDVWFQRIFPEQWQVRIEGVEGFPKNVADYHHRFYNQVHVGDATELVERLVGPWDVTIYGDVLEHFSKEVARRLLRHSIEHSEYVLLNVPLGDGWPQGEVYGNRFEQHLSSWTEEELLEFPAVRHALFRDYVNRPFGTFCFSRRDPRGLRASLFSPNAGAAAEGETLLADPQLEDMLRRAGEMADELGYIKRSPIYRRAMRVRATPVYGALRWMRSRNQRLVTVQALGQRHPDSQGSEVWLLRARPHTGGAHVPWDFMDHDRSWFLTDRPDSPLGRCLVSSGGRLRLPVDDDPELTLLTHPYSGRVEVSFQGRQQVIDLYSAQASRVIVHPARSPMANVPAVEALPESAAGPRTGAPVAGGAATFSPGEQRFIDEFHAAGGTVLATSCPRWLGVTHSTRSQFPHWYPIPARTSEDPALLTDEALRHQCGVLLATGARHVVFSGGDQYQIRLAELLHEADSRIRCDLFWHGSYIQFSEPSVWALIKGWIEAARRGSVYSIATTKAGQERFFQKLNIRSCLLLNRVDGDPQPAPQIDSSERQLGLWLSGRTYRKLPHAMISAAAMMTSVRLHAAGIDAQTREVIEFLGVPAETLSDAPLSAADLPAAIRRTHLTLYVTFVECCPMLPLESLTVGVPALTGPNSHLFDDHPFLFERLVVPFPDRAEMIADYAERAIAEREAIIAEYQRYLPAYEQRCRAAFEAFLRL